MGHPGSPGGRQRKKRGRLDNNSVTRESTSFCGLVWLHFTRRVPEASWSCRFNRRVQSDSESEPYTYLYLNMTIVTWLDERPSVAFLEEFYSMWLSSSPRPGSLLSGRLEFGPVWGSLVSNNNFSRFYFWQTVGSALVQLNRG